MTSSGLLAAALLAVFPFTPGEKTTPADANQLLQHAVELHRQGDLNGAIAAYRDFLKLKPNEVMALSNLGAALARTGDLADAITEYRHALKVQPGNQQVRLNLALAYYKAARIHDAVPELEQIHRADPANYQATLLLADSLLLLGKNKEVAGLLSPLAAQHADDRGLDYLLGTALIRDNQTAQGQVVIDRILRNGDSAEAHLLLGMTKMNAREFGDALTDLKRAVELNPKLPDVYSYYGQALLATGDPNGAQAAFRQELASNPNDFDANIQLGALLRQDEKLDEARQCFSRALETRPGNLAVRYQFAMLALNDGKMEQCRQELESITREAPSFTEAHVSLATVYYRLKRKSDGDHERGIVQQLNAAAQAKQPGVAQ